MHGSGRDSELVFATNNTVSFSNLQAQENAAET